MALDFGITLVFVPRADRTVHMTSLNFGGAVEFSLDEVPPCRRGDSPAEENCWCGESCVQKDFAHAASQDEQNFPADLTTCGVVSLQGQLSSGGSPGVAHTAAQVPLF